MNEFGKEIVIPENTVKINHITTITIDLARYTMLLRAERDLELLKKSYLDGPYGVDSAVEKVILGPKPAPPKPDPVDAALAAVKSAVESAEKAADMAAKMACSVMGEEDHA